MNKTILMITIIIVLIISIGFYWYEWRPTQIKKSCALTATNFSPDAQDNFYKNCVLQNGIKP